MFRQLARMIQQSPDMGFGDVLGNRNLFDLHPLFLTLGLEAAWATRSALKVGPGAEGDEFRLPPQMMAALSLPASMSADNDAIVGLPIWDKDGDRTVPPTWDHLIYAYMLENTRIYDTFGGVIREFAHGERLGSPSSAGRSWLRATEELFYYNTPPFQLSSLISHVRPDIRASRRNAYYRMFGMDLNHGAESGPYPYQKPEAANREFVKVFEDLLREVWRAIENSGNTSGPNPTDDTVLINLCRTLANMLTSRRINGNLAREEFVYVATMSWLHLTLEYDSPIVLDLRAQATSPAERLRLVGERVGVPSHAKSDSYFALAEAMSRILIMMEQRIFETQAGARTLYAPLDTAGLTNPIRGLMTSIITHWSVATGRPMKAPTVEVAAPAVTRSGVAAIPSPVGSNGSMPVAAAESTALPVS